MLASYHSVPSASSPTMFSLHLYSPLLLTLLITSTHLSSAAPPLDPNSDPTDCSCYQVPGNERAWFLNHQFFDFREAGNDNVTARFTPALIDNDQDGGIEPITSPFFGKGQFGDYFTPASWTKNATEDAPVHLVNSQQNIYLSKCSPLSIAEDGRKTDGILRPSPRFSRFSCSSHLADEPFANFPIIVRS